LCDLGGFDLLDLSRDHGEHLEFDSVEFVEAAPNTCDRQSLENTGCIVVTLLWCAVGDNDLDSKGTTHVLGGFSFASTSRTSRRSSELHTECLGESDIALVCKSCNTETLFGAQILVRLPEVDVGNRNDTVIVFFKPVETGLLLPIELFEFLGNFDDVAEDFHQVDVDRDDCFDFLAFQTVEVSQTHTDQSVFRVVHFLLKRHLIPLFGQFVLWLARAIEDEAFASECPVELHTHE
jgi:hypothetical protein